MEHIYYADRPSVPNTQQNVVHLPAILEHSLLINLDNIHNMFYANAVEVKDETGTVQGTLLYVGGVSFSTLISDEEVARSNVHRIPFAHGFRRRQGFRRRTEGLEDDSAKTVAEASTPPIADEIVADLERELAEARQAVAYVEAEIASWRTDELS